MIEITETISLSSDPENWIVTLKTKSKQPPPGVALKNEYQISDRYFNTLQNALRFIVDQDLKTAKSLEEMSEKLDEWRTVFQKVFSFVFL